ncbi:MAG: GNAT family N-acetyltransferase [Pirellulales bacterium]|nr:GNAT family N-acetyltransferase [Pirellulales bacterium]
MSECHLIGVDQPKAWDDALARCGRFDCYHLAGYHALANQRGEGEPYLLFFEHAGHCAGLPILVRPVAAIDGLDGFPLCDATSVYGYPGVVTSIERSQPAAETFRTAFQRALAEALDRLGIVCLFTRHNPLMDSSWMLAPMAEVSLLGPTVAVDLSQSDERQTAGIRQGHRYEIRRARKSGVTVCDDPSFGNLETFERIYTQTMKSLEADEYYYFDHDYFTALVDHLPGRVKLLFSQVGGQMIAGAMFLLCGDVVQYHLSGTAPEFAGVRGGMKVILDEMRIWATQNGFSWLHLGGGLGARRDSLFEFKAGFSRTLFSFETTKLVRNHLAYQEILFARSRWLQRQGFESCTGNYFPAYRQAPLRRAA